MGKLNKSKEFLIHNKSIKTELVENLTDEQASALVVTSHPPVSILSCKCKLCGKEFSHAIFYYEHYDKEHYNKDDL